MPCVAKNDRAHAVMQVYLASAAGTRKVDGKVKFKMLSQLVVTDEGELAAEAHIRGVFAKDNPGWKIGNLMITNETKKVRHFVDENPRIH